ncbi:metallo-beta-lactamase domain-containing protein 1 isoform X1 [Scleropages formosus]|uniref:metallo-beta-lactamase domain-containing protein 1 isoform X1 n=1 Tax=Scleropages formosus TaxID=113540 RepID=UPI0010FAB158|nr:metallo-beta-lactamase domain-containing protein 1 isoform X1 [Scleropages formosus]
MELAAPRSSSAPPEIGPEIPGEPYSVSLLQQGYSAPQPDGSTRADCTVSLVRGPCTVLVDTGGPWGRDRLLQRLRDRGVEPGDVHVVVGTHGHSDHIGNLALFPEATIIVGGDVSRGDRYLEDGPAEGRPFRIDAHVGCGLSGGRARARARPRPVLGAARVRAQDPLKVTAASLVCVLATPGHTGRDVSVLVRGTSLGSVLLAGDLFERHDDEDVWRQLSENPALQEASRKEALLIADVIVPGHGAPFGVPRGPRDGAAAQGQERTLGQSLN